MNVMQKNLQNLIQCNITIIDISKDFSSHYFLSKKRLSERESFHLSSVSFNAANDGF